MKALVITFIIIVIPLFLVIMLGLSFKKKQPDMKIQKRTEVGLIP